MCGIAGIVYKDRKLHNAGEDMGKMLGALQHRGPDSAGFAIYGGVGLEKNEYNINIQVNQKTGLLDKVKMAINQKTPIKSDQVFPSEEDGTIVYRAKIALDEFRQLPPLLHKIDKVDVDVVVLNGSHSFEMIKDIGHVKDIVEKYHVNEIKGTHAIGHTRFSTESNVDRYHAHPFQTYIIKDVTVVHNGQITNYWKIRDPLERKGHVFETNNDTECLVHYISDKLDQGYILEEALHQSVEDMDGPFSYIIGTPEGIGIAKDRLGLRPGVMAENDKIFAIASEEVSLREVMDTTNVEQISPGEVRVYESTPSF
ncbi:MAG: glutamine amidotransferase [Methanobrevibacter sp.]|jgi:glutamate synthase domain-containing protein 1|nr:glutamine amidotransferase [Candidatus Methanovirga aequatorialis]